VKPGTKRKLQTHKPVIGGVVEEFACVYAVLAVNGHDCTPVKIGACSNLVGHLEDLQRATPFDLEIVDAFWFPDLRLARRVAVEARVSYTKGEHFRGEWYGFDEPRDAALLIVEAAHRLRIPALGMKDYLKLCKSPQQMKDGAMDEYLRRLGIS
jgi:hypothetical protein